MKLRRPSREFDQRHLDLGFSDQAVVSFQTLEQGHARAPGCQGARTNDKRVVDLDLKGRKISIRPEVELSKPFGITSWRTSAALKNIKVRKLDP